MKIENEEQREARFQAAARAIDAIKELTLNPEEQDLHPTCGEVGERLAQTIGPVLTDDELAVMLMWLEVEASNRIAPLPPRQRPITLTCFAVALSSAWLWSLTLENGGQWDRPEDQAAFEYICERWEAWRRGER
jgi:hypothetical protein